ncbi:uncharacterized protein [Triticum aestivum]|uniref:uncharacterized protein n=1 Tax=Triticum aestivum TaxID=4565 RepID=UPI001D021E5D|nr:uncharacterized protein LOC123071551 [Triticum aestivum]
MDSWNSAASPYSAHLLYASSVSACDNQLLNSHSSMRGTEFAFLDKRAVQGPGNLPFLIVKYKFWRGYSHTNVNQKTEGPGNLPFLIVKCKFWRGYSHTNVNQKTEVLWYFRPCTRISVRWWLLQSETMYENLRQVVGLTSRIPE